MIVVDTIVLAYLCLPSDVITSALKLGARLVTMDTKLLQAFPERAVALNAG